MNTRTQLAEMYMKKKKGNYKYQNEVDKICTFRDCRFYIHTGLNMMIFTHPQLIS